MKPVLCGPRTSDASEQRNYSKTALMHTHLNCSSVIMMVPLRRWALCVQCLLNSCQLVMYLLVVYFFSQSRYWIFLFLTWNTSPDHRTAAHWNTSNISPFVTRSACSHIPHITIAIGVMWPQFIQTCAHTQQTCVHSSVSVVRAKIYFNAKFKGQTKVPLGA